MKPHTIAKEIIVVFIAILFLNPAANCLGSSPDKIQTLETPKPVAQKQEKVDLENSSQPELDIIFVLDNSGSMLKNDPQFITRQVVKDFLAGLGEGVRVGMVVFDQDANLVEPLTVIRTPEAHTNFLKSLATIDYKGQFTNSPAGVERAIYELDKRGRESAGKVIVLLTDGIVDTGDKQQDLESEKWLEDHLAEECRKTGIRIFGIAFTDKADFRLMQILASKTNGEYFRAYRAEDIHDVFKKIIDLITQPPIIIQPETKAVPAAVHPAARKERPSETPHVNGAYAQKGAAFLPLIVSIAVLLMGIIGLALVFKRKTEDRIALEKSKKRSADSLPPDHPVFQAELIDAENIVSKDSLSLALNKESVSIGRDSSNDIVIPKESVSSLHATIDYKNGHFYLEDHRSTNGTRLNDMQINQNEPVKLKSGDKIHFAVYEFRFLLHDKAPFGETVMISKDEI